MDFEPDALKGQRLEAALSNLKWATLTVRRAPDMLTKLGEKSRLTPTLMEDVRQEAEKSIVAQHEDSIIGLASTAVRTRLARSTPRSMSIEEISHMPTAKLAVYAGLGVAQKTVRSTVASAIPETLTEDVHSRKDSLEHAVRHRMQWNPIRSTLHVPSLAAYSSAPPLASSGGPAGEAHLGSCAAAARRIRRLCEAEP